MRSMISKGRKLERFYAPMLAKETDKAFDDTEWIFEIKWDGYRAVAEISKGEVKLYSRNGLSFNEYYPNVVNALKKIRKDIVIDGEIVVLNENGLPNFQMLQHYSEYQHYPIVYYVFDVLKANGKDLTSLPLTERKKILRTLFKFNDVIRYSDHIEAKGKDFLQIAKEKGLEGIMAKKADSEYYTGKRTNEWLKIKNHMSDEAIIVGYTEPTGGRKNFGALVLAVKDGKELRYAGHTGTGFNQRTLKEVYDLLQPIRTDHSPFKERVKTNTPVTWVEPKYVCELKFTEKTNDGRMRHPVFLRLREDKRPTEVTKEKAKGQFVKKEATTSKNKKEQQIIVADKHKVTITNPSKIYFPEQKLTKLDVVQYYEAISRYILPYLKDRPESLNRFPNGITQKGFYNKDAANDVPSFVKNFPHESDSAGKIVNYIVCNNKATLLYMANMGCIEMNPWHSTVRKPDHPDYFILDIDPSDNNTSDQVIEAALAVKEVLDTAGIQGYCKTSGATGLHIYVPTAKKYDYEQVKNFAQIICAMAQELVPSFTTLERNLKKRGPNRIYMDFLQNRSGQTISSVYSLRPRNVAPVSTPLEWKELKKGLVFADHNIKTIFKRLEKKGDIFKPILGPGIDMLKALKKLKA